MTNKQTGTSGLVEVTQADRDAAAPIFRLYGAANYAELCSAGVSWCDSLDVVQAFAKHRLASLPPVPVDEVEDFLHELDGWERAYPLSAFPEPDLKRAAELLKAGGLTLDAVSASNMRHVVSKIAPKARAVIAALTASRPSDDGWMPIESFAEPTALSSGNGVLVADADGTVGEAYYRNFGDEDDGWWWSNTTWGDYPRRDRPNPAHWRPLPDPPAALSSLVGEK